MANSIGRVSGARGPRDEEHRHRELWRAGRDRRRPRPARHSSRCRCSSSRGPVVTAGGLLFIGATNFDKKFRAFDKATGQLLWETTLPYAGNATPSTYSVNGQ